MKRPRLIGDGQGVVLSCSEPSLAVELSAEPALPGIGAPQADPNVQSPELPDTEEAREATGRFRRTASRPDAKELNTETVSSRLPIQQQNL